MEIKFNNSSFTYKRINYADKEILKGLNIGFEFGKVYGVIGKTGSGKTTLLELISGIIKPTDGEIIYSKEIENKVAISFQNPDNQFISKTVGEELLSVLKIANYKLNNAIKRMEDALKMVSLDNSYLKASLDRLTSSEKRKISLAGVLITNPKVIILDEPTVGLDAKSKNELIKLIRVLKNRFKKIIIIASNDIDFIHKMVDYIYVLNNKRIVLEGNKYQVFKDEKTLRKYDISVPKIIEFENLVLENKKIKLGYRDEINDLIKDIYRNIN